LSMLACPKSQLCAEWAVRAVQISEEKLSLLTHNGQPP
jgi:hypothetical protein